MHMCTSLIVASGNSVEIIKEVKVNGPNLNELLKTPLNQLEENCVDHALIAAVESGNHSSVGKLILHGASNIDQALEASCRLRKHVVTAAFLIVKAAMENDRTLVLKLYGENVQGLDTKIPLAEEDDLTEIQNVVCNHTIKTVVPIEIARRSGASEVRAELLLRTDVDKESGTVLWYGLRLTQLEISWLQKIHWVKKLKLARNLFTFLPPEMGNYLKQCTKLDLQRNEVREIPCCLLELPSINELNLSHNKIVEIPDVPKWSASLSVLDLSYNHLSSLPNSAVAPTLKNLNLSNNKFHTIPHCVCSFIDLTTLNIAFNSEILALPFELGQLKNLLNLNLDGLNNLRNPPKSVCVSTVDCIRYLNNCLCSCHYHMKLVIVGKQGVGKSTIAARLLGENIGDESTVGVSIREWKYNPTSDRETIHFSIWDFVGQEENYATHQCFLSKRSLYLLVWNITKGDTGIADLKSWLNDISARVPDSCVIVVGTFLDMVSEEDRQVGKLDDLVKKVQKLTAQYKHLSVTNITLVGLQGHLENVTKLKEYIYNAALKYLKNFMGGKLPSSYHVLAAKLSTIHQKVKSGDHEPIMHATELKRMVRDLNIVDLQDDRELHTAVKYLHEIGVLLHYDDRRCNLDDLYFIDPAWLCDFVSTLVTTLQRNCHLNLKEGIVSSKNFCHFFDDMSFFPIKYFQQCLTLLCRLEIAFPLDSDNKRIAIPSMFPKVHPAIVNELLLGRKDHYKRFIIFCSSVSEGESLHCLTPSGLWSRLLFRIMNNIKELREALSETDICSENEAQQKSNKSSPDSMKHSFNLEKGSLSGVELVAAPVPPSNKKVTSLLNNQESSDRFPTIEGCGSLVYWDKGLFYNENRLTFIIESLVETDKHQERDGILIMCSPTPEGRKVLGQLVDLVEQLISEWYPGLDRELNHKVLCHECIKADFRNPYEFEVDRLLPMIAEHNLLTECGAGHQVQIIDIVPDLLLADLDSSFFLDANELTYKKKEGNLLRTGAFGEVYHGAYKGQSVIVKSYTAKEESKLKEYFKELRSESTVLQLLHHPCLVCMVGVTVHPTMLLVVEEAPQGTLHVPLIIEQRAFSRIVMYRIAIQVASALRFLHSINIYFYDLRSDNILLWSLSPDNLINCKVSDFKGAAHADHGGSHCLHYTKGFLAPEVANISNAREHSVYDHRADIFSFGMFLYQLIARRDPFHDLQAVEIEAAIEKGDRPELNDIPIAEVGLYYMTRVMKKCWVDRAVDRPETQVIVEWFSCPALQLIMTVLPIANEYSICNGCISAPSHNEFNIAAKSSELWICSHGNAGIELNIFNTNTMVNVDKHFVRYNQVWCMKQCGDHIWVASQSGLEDGVVDIFNKNTKLLVHRIRKNDIDKNAVSCITSSKDLVYMGTINGCIFSFPMDIQAIQNNLHPQCRYVSESHRIDGIVITSTCIWVSTSNHIHFLKPENLAVEDVIKRTMNTQALVGQMMLSLKGNQVWSAHDVIMSLWDAHQRVHLGDVDVGVIVEEKCHVGDSEGQKITAMCTGLDTIWIGLASGHIIVFGMNSLGEVLTYFRPYHSYVRFLSAANYPGPCKEERCMMLSGGKMYQPDDGFKHLPDFTCKNRVGQPVDKSGVAILWEVLPARYMRQVHYLGEGTSYLNYSRLKETMMDTGFTEYRDRRSTEECELTMLLTKLYPEFLVNSDEVNYKDNRKYLSGMGYFCQGEYKGQSVSIKFCTADERSAMEEFLRELCSVGKMVQQLHHPCVTHLLGVTVYHTVSLVLEEPSCGILRDLLLKEESIIPRIVVYRIVIQAASALSYLRDRNIFCFPLTTDNVLLWSLSPDCLINCKLIAFNIAAVNPVVSENDPDLTASKVDCDSVASNCYLANICSFGEFLYQLMIHRCHIQHYHPDLPELQNTPLPKTSLFYMQKLCLSYNSNQSYLSSEQIIEWLSVPMHQLVMSIITVSGNHNISCGCITPTVITKTASILNPIELWICCNGVRQSELTIFEAERVKNVPLKNVQVSYMNQCGDSIWMASQDDLKHGIIYIFDQHLQTLICEIKGMNCIVSCITNSDCLVYIGTEEGYCFAIPMEIQATHSNIWSHYHKRISEYCIDGVVLTQTHLWVSSCNQIYFLNSNTLEVEGVEKRTKKKHACIGKMMLCDNGDEVWNAHLGGVIMSSWNAHQCVHLCDIDVGVIAKEKCHVGDPRDQIITAMCTGLDTVWIGLASGHIIVFGMNPPVEVLTYIRPYHSYVRFLSATNYPGPCEKVECVMLSGGKVYQPDDRFREISDWPHKNKSYHPVNNAGVVLLWEVLPAKYVHQVHFLRDGKAWLSYDRLEKAICLQNH